MKGVVPPIIYLDSCVVSDLATKNLKLRDVFDACGCPHAIFAFSMQSVLEAIRGDLPPRIAARALVIDKLANLWLPNPVGTRDLELAHFLKPDFSFRLTTEHCFATLGKLMQFELGAEKVTNPERYSASYFACDKIQSGLDDPVIDMWFKFGECVRQRLTASQGDFLDIVGNLQLARGVIVRYGLAESDEDSMRMIVKIGAASSDLRAECPALEIEKLLSEFRTSGAVKNNTSNTYDFFHVWAALAGCNFFVSTDKGALDAVEYVNTRYPSMCTAVKIG